MAKRYQVFVSSTYKDLIKYRQLVIKSLMKVNAIPVGMEDFPATDDDAWTLIKHIIDDSDYYMVVIGGRYGSTDSDGTSYTEKEYDYAVKQGKPVMAFLHGDLKEIPSGDTDTDPLIVKKLEQFRSKVRQRHCKSWTNETELIESVLASYILITTSHPAVGWVRGDQARTGEDAEILSKLQQNIASLETKNDNLQKELQPYQDSNQDDTNSVPLIAKTYDSFYRRLTLEWEIHKTAPIKDYQSVSDLLDKANNTLLEYYIELSHTKYPDIYSDLKDACVIIRNMLALNSTKVRESFAFRHKFWGEGEKLFKLLGNLDISVSTKTWD